MFDEMYGSSNVFSKLIFKPTDRFRTAKFVDMNLKKIILKISRHIAFFTNWIVRIVNYLTLLEEIIRSKTFRIINLKFPHRSQNNEKQK